MEEKKALEYERIFRALGDKHRLYILDLLMERERNAGELLELVDVVQSTLSHHMKSLCDSGLVIPRKEKKWTYYAVSTEVVEAAREFLKKYLEETEECLPVEAEEILENENALTDVSEELAETEEREETEEAAEITLYANMKSSKKKKTEKEKKSSDKKKGNKKNKKDPDKKDSEKKGSDKKKDKKEAGKKKEMKK